MGKICDLYLKTDLENIQTQVLFVTPLPQHNGFFVIYKFLSNLCLFKKSVFNNKKYTLYISLSDDWIDNERIGKK